MAYTTKEKKTYLREYGRAKAAGKKPRTFGEFLKKKRGKLFMTKRTAQISDQLRQAGVTEEKIKDLRD